MSVSLALLRHELQCCQPCSMLTNQYKLNKVSLKRNMHEACINCVLMGRPRGDQRLAGTQPCVSPRSSGSVFSRVFAALPL